MTQEQLAEKIGITSKQLSRIEISTYTPSLPTFLKIVKELKIDLKEFDIEEYNNSTPTKREFIKLIENISDTELEFCYETFKTMVKNFNILDK